MILHNDNLIVTIDDLIFRSHQHVAPQYVFDPDALQGFYDGVSAKRSDTVRPNQFGDFAEPGLLNSRNMTISGTAVARTPKELHAMRDKFVGLYVNGGYREISISNTTETRFITATLNGQPSWVQKLDNVAVWKMDLYAPDPRMYGPQKTAQVADTTITGGVDYPLDYPLDYGGGIKSQTVSLTNLGNTDAWPVFVVRGDFFSGFAVTNSAGREIRYNGVVSMADPVTIDTAQGTATQGGTDKSTLLTRREWFSIPAGGSIQPQFIPIQDAVGWCDIMYRDTWI